MWSSEEKFHESSKCKVHWRIWMNHMLGVVFNLNGSLNLKTTFSRARSVLRVCRRMPSLFWQVRHPMFSYVALLRLGSDVSFRRCSPLPWPLAWASSALLLKMLVNNAIHQFHSSLVLEKTHKLWLASNIKSYMEKLMACRAHLSHHQCILECGLSSVAIIVSLSVFLEFRRAVSI